MRKSSQQSLTAVAHSRLFLSSAPRPQTSSPCPWASLTSPVYLRCGTGTVQMECFSKMLFWLVQVTLHEAQLHTNTQQNNVSWDWRGWEAAWWPALKQLLRCWGGDGSAAADVINAGVRSLQFLHSILTFRLLIVCLFRRCSETAFSLFLLSCSLNYDVIFMIH